MVSKWAAFISEIGFDEHIEVICVEAASRKSATKQILQQAEMHYKPECGYQVWNIHKVNEEIVFEKKVEED